MSVNRESSSRAAEATEDTARLPWAGLSPLTKLSEYQQNLTWLTTRFPEFRFLQEKFLRSIKPRVLCVDAFDGERSQVRRKLPSCQKSEPVTFHDWAFENFWGDVKFTRLFLIEDFQLKFMTRLGAFLDLDPRFFIEHLHQQVPNAEAENEQLDDRKLSSRWKKPFVSVRWLRPVRRTDSNSSQLRKSMKKPFANSSQEIGRILDAGDDYVRSSTNILREEVDLTLNTNSSSTMKGIAAIEECVTIYPVSSAGITFGRFRRGICKLTGH